MRVVSLVPSLTEAVATTLPGLLVGATDWCTHPADLDVPRVGGTKYPDLDRVRSLRPDLVLLNVEENRRADADALAAAGIPTRVTYPRTVDGALTELADLLHALGCAGQPRWLTRARAEWAALPATPVPRRAVVPVWRRPWVVLGADTFAGDLLRRLGVANAYAEQPQRYQRPSLPQLRDQAPELVVLPDEPYRFTRDDGPEAFPGVPCALVSGRHLTWYGPSLAEAPALLAAQLADLYVAH
ncbi:helical backbone metal receptor [Verrucosispora sioxanthis]|uniref:Cobalamin-binding protein n=1 Tax=Verrucosispora sioxanthis TaxID=2499994 RepID=A0A6M1L3P2_9ACTN|nr:helical backbone metal receptor [Verrucosispora sioxanthis]NEE64347.1 cobalamin-binding protein [Verrucosispora sioxanthis]NGM13457.1 cobalamin-binding protein [Verrucosispora sioxanthis]